jgi:hypothetical protein
MTKDPREAEARPRSTISEEEITSGDVPRRAFLRGAGVLLGSALLGTTAACELSDSCDRDVGDPVRYDYDPHDPVRADSDYGDRCDSD